jgi:D-3-phosphoglycerate dehydrogenase
LQVQRRKIFISESDRFTPEALMFLKTFAEVSFGDGSKEQLKDAFLNSDVVWIRLANKIDRTFFSSDMKCRVIACAVTGIDHINLSDCHEFGVQIVCLKGETEFLKEVRATAELTMGLMLALIRKIPQASASVKSGIWNRDLFAGSELFKKTIGIVGLGRLGLIVAEYAKSFGMSVLAYDKHQNFPSDIQKLSSLTELCSLADVISIHLSYDDSTKEIFDSTCFNAMKCSAVLINTARGGIVDEKALLLALESKKIRGAALDVLNGEPGINESHPLVQYAIKNDNLLIVPHIGGNTPESFEKTELFIAKKIQSILAL